MKVHLVSARWSNYPWGFGNDVYDVLVDLGIEVIDTDYRLERVRLPELLGQSCDLVLVLKGEGIPPALVYSAPGRTVLWYPDDLIATEHGKQHIAHNGHAFDTVYGISKWDLDEYRKMNCRDVRWLPLACNPKIHRKMNLPKFFDVGFVGTLYPEREALLERLSKSFDVQRWMVYGEFMVRAFNYSRIVLNLPVGGIKSGNLPHRVFEALACGSLLFTNDVPGLAELFTDREHLVCYNQENIEDLLSYYLEHEDEREVIAEAGRKEVLDKHTVRHRVERILVESSLTNKGGQNDYGRAHDL